MRKLEYIVSKGHDFWVDNEEPFIISAKDLQQILRMGALAYTLMKTAMSGISDGDSGSVENVLTGTQLEEKYRTIGRLYPEIPPSFFRVDLMIDTMGNWKVAEIDPSNKHGLGFALATRNESGAGERQKLLSLLAPYVTDDMWVVLAKKESFYTREQKYFAGKLSEYTGKKVTIVHEEQVAKKLGSGMVFDFPVCGAEATDVLAARWVKSPESFVNPPRHALGSKAIMALLHEHRDWLVANGMSKDEVEELKQFVPPTYFGPFVRKEIFSSGSRGVSFDTAFSEAVYQKYIPQKSFKLAGQDRFIRLACHFIGNSLGELTVSASPELPVHGGNQTVNYHVGLRK